MATFDKLQFSKIILRKEIRKSSLKFIGIVLGFSQCHLSYQTRFSRSKIKEITKRVSVNDVYKISNSVYYWFTPAQNNGVCTIHTHCQDLFYRKKSRISNLRLLFNPIHLSCCIDHLLWHSGRNVLTFCTGATVRKEIKE